jgi:uncharacterized protein (DUF2235 family)
LISISRLLFAARASSAPFGVHTERWNSHLFPKRHVKSGSRGAAILLPIRRVSWRPGNDVPFELDRDVLPQHRNRNEQTQSSLWSQDNSSIALKRSIPYADRISRLEIGIRKQVGARFLEVTNLRQLAGKQRLVSHVQNVDDQITFHGSLPVSR